MRRLLLSRLAQLSVVLGSLLGAGNALACGSTCSDCNPNSIAPGQRCDQGLACDYECCTSCQCAGDEAHDPSIFQCCRTFHAGRNDIKNSCNADNDCCFGYCINSTTPGQPPPYTGTCCSYFLPNPTNCQGGGGQNTIMPGQPCQTNNPLQCTTRDCGGTGATGTCCSPPQGPGTAFCCPGELVIPPGANSPYGQQTVGNCCIVGQTLGCGFSADCCSGACTGGTCQLSGPNGHCQTTDDCQAPTDGCFDNKCWAQGTHATCMTPGQGCMESSQCCQTPNPQICGPLNTCVPPLNTGDKCAWWLAWQTNRFPNQTSVYQAGCPAGDICPWQGVNGKGLICCGTLGVNVGPNNQALCCAGTMDHNNNCTCIAIGGNCAGAKPDSDCCGYPAAMCEFGKCIAF